MKIALKYLAFIVCLMPKLLSAQTLTLTIDAKNNAQTIDNIGASGCWFSERDRQILADGKTRKNGRVIIQ
ncbi:hypothetical protein [Mucilaginibacter sp. UYCu711]|uniref:hypothetical protein n=1 Tax=Mucilaginibacter sp. UYCu711 TaxID=3156339 RepID=UPI003D263BAB